MARYDLENYLVDVLAVMTTNLNTVIGAINTEKNDSITLKTVDANAYFLQTLDSAAANYDPYILYGIENIETVSMGPHSGHKVTVSVVIVLADFEDLNVTKRILRYGRALEQCFQENFQNNDQGLRIEVQSLVPVQFQALNSSYRYRAIGVLLTTDMPQ